MIEARASDLRALAVGVVGPLGLVAAAYFLWSLSDRLLYIGPLDRATFSWAVVMPIWLISPAVAALLWQRLTEREASLVAVATGAVISASAAWLVWIAFNPAACETSPRTSAPDLIGPSILLGLLIGGGWAAIGWLGRAVAAGPGDPKVATVVGAVALAVGHLFLVLGAYFFVIIWFAGCNPPWVV